MKRTRGSRAFFVPALLVVCFAAILQVEQGSWFFAVADLFRQWMILAAFVIAALAAAGRAPVSMMLAGAAALVLLAPMGQIGLAASHGQRTPGEEPLLTVASLNVLAGREDYEPVIDMLRRQAPDVVMAQEATPVFDNAMKRAGLYAYEANVRSSVEIYSRFPIVSTVPIFADPTDREAEPIARRVELAMPMPDGTLRSLVLWSVHATTLRSQAQLIQRNAHILRVTQLIASETPGSDLVVAGDFNAVLWGRELQILMQAGKLKSAAPFWQAATRFGLEFDLPAWFGVPIDQILVSDSLAVSNHRTLGPVGSDHLPVLVDIFRKQP